MTGDVQQHTAGLVVSRDAVTYATKRWTRKPLKVWGPAHPARLCGCLWILHTVSAKTDILLGLLFMFFCVSSSQNGSLEYLHTLNSECAVKYSAYLS